MCIGNIITLEYHRTIHSSHISPTVWQKCFISGFPIAVLLVKAIHESDRLQLAMHSYTPKVYTFKNSKALGFRKSSHISMHVTFPTHLYPKDFLGLLSEVDRCAIPRLSGSPESLRFSAGVCHIVGSGGEGEVQAGLS